MGHPCQGETMHSIYLGKGGNGHTLLRPAMHDLRRCETRIRTSPPKLRTPPVPSHTISSNRMESYPRTSTGKTNILLSNLCTEWVEAFVISNPKSPVIIRRLKEQDFRYCYLNVITSDNEKQFINGSWSRALQTWGIQDIYYSLPSSSQFGQ